MRDRCWKALVFCGLVLGFLVPRAGAAGPADDWAPVVVPAAQQLDVRGAATGQHYRIFLSVPANPPPPTGYPVLYVLDGNAAFPVAALLARSMASRSEVTGKSAPLVVGIGYAGEADFNVPARALDYTLPSPVKVPMIKGPTGGADRFLDFIEQEVKPLVAARYAVNPRRQALFGHSFGGLLVLHAMFTRPQAFSTYLASSPSVWWGERVVLTEVPGFLRQEASGPRPRLQISVGAREDDPEPGLRSAEMQALLASRLMIPDIGRLAARLLAAPGGHDRVAFHLLDGENHGSAWLPALVRGMDFFLE